MWCRSQLILNITAVTEGHSSCYKQRLPKVSTGRCPSPLLRTDYKSSGLKILTAGQKKLKIIPSEVHVQFTVFESEDLIISVLHFKHIILPLHLSGQGNTVKFLSRIFWNVRINFSLVLQISVEQEVYNSKRQSYPAWRARGIRDYGYLLKIVYKDIFVDAMC